ncbi:Putative nuclease HARBI1 [Eumeta japonica]|uniref:Nuclease HARBI1 n=1 Tax=Eumeta variegata TaxID=151549 RepID=A0A4C1VST5_EUMVA|nr:Putative nuclease HARBI1 [Eumeta japonica]
MLESMLSTNEDQEISTTTNESDNLLLEIQSHFQEYKKERRLPLNEDPLVWWKLNSHKYRNLLPLVRQYLSVPPSNVASEQLFSGAGLIYEEHRNRLLGCIDCTHIKIKNPGGSQADVFRNRKRWFSLNVQVVGGPNLQFFDIVARWPGSSHDNFIYNSSSVKQRMLSGEIEGLLLGDNGYALSSTLMTPFMSPSGSAQERYNNAHIKTRNTIERAFRIWKRRFPCLQLGLNIKKETAVAVICACAALHNIALQCDDLQFEPDMVPEMYKILTSKDWFILAVSIVDVVWYLALWKRRGYSENFRAAEAGRSRNLQARTSYVP